MKLATIQPEPNRPGNRDGQLVVVRSDQQSVARVPPEKWPTLLAALEDWAQAEPYLAAIARKVEQDTWTDTIPANRCTFLAPLPRTWAWLDGSAFIQHIILVRKARGAEPPEGLYDVPLMYQGISDYALGPREPIPLEDEAFGLDFEGEFAVVLDHVPRGTPAEQAGQHIKLLLLMNDISLRNLIPRELATGFGFIQGKPASGYAPFAITPDELGDAWRDGRVHCDLTCTLNGARFGSPGGGAMHFSFGQLITHAARTRDLSACTILGSGTVSSEQPGAGYTCIAERRMVEKIETGTMTTPFLKVGDVIEMEVLHQGQSVFGKLCQTVVPLARK
jgi:fumarylacetoacetate (FAA) hydrolase